MFLLIITFLNSAFCANTTLEISNDYEINEGDYSSYKLNTENLIISKGVTTINNYAFREWPLLKKVSFSSSVRKIGFFSFSDCTNLKEISFENGITTIDDSAFAGCTSLTEIIIPDSVTSIGLGPFSFCKSLHSIKVSDLNTKYSNYKNDGVLYSKDISTIIRYPEGNKNETFVIPKPVTSIGISAFGYCNNLITVIIGENVKTIYNIAFCYCNKLSKIIIPNSVTSIHEWAFESCINLETVILGENLGRRQFFSNLGLTNLIENIE